MTFIDDQISVIRNDVVYLAFADQTLHQRHIDHTGRLAFSVPDGPDLLRVDFEEGAQPLDPLAQDFPTVDQDKGIARTMPDKGRGHDGLAECGRGGKHAVVVLGQCIERERLLLAKFATKKNRLRQRGSVDTQVT